MVKLYVERSGSDVSYPEYSTPEAACMDVRAHLHEPVVVPVCGSVMIPTGLTMDCSQGYRIALYARSGLACKHGITLRNDVGIIDSDYRGEVKVCLQNLGDEAIMIHDRDRIAQMAVEKVVPVEIIPTVFDYGMETGRSSEGFGSTGIK